MSIKWTPDLTQKIVYIWDCNKPPENLRNVLLWNNYDLSDYSGCFSLTSLVEENAEKYRKRYLNYVYNSRIPFISRNGYDILCASLIKQKSSYIKTSTVEDIIKLFAAVDCLNLFSGININIRVVSNNVALVKAIKNWCIGGSKTCEWIKFNNSKNPQINWFQKLYAYFPEEVKALGYLLKHIVERWPLRGVGVSEWKASKARTLFVSYLINLSPQGLLKGKYESRYWDKLPDLLNTENHATNWMHLYMKSSIIPNAKSAASTIDLLNKKQKGQQIHVTLDSFLSLSVIFNTLIDWIKLRKFGSHFSDSVSRLGGQDSFIWPLIRSDWESSTRGASAIGHGLYMNLFDSALKALPKQNTGVYLLENLGWEFCFIQTWRASKHGCIIGWPHSSVRFWDLRYFFDPREYSSQCKNPLPRPDYVAISGYLDKRQYINGGYPEEQIMDVEALRFLHLNDNNNELSNNQIKPNQDNSLNLLCLGDADEKSTRFQLELLEKISKLINANLRITLKIHPACRIDLRNFSTLSFITSNLPVNELLSSHDIAFTGNLTGAAIEAYCAGLKTIIALDFARLNKSPLRGIEDVTFVSSSEELLSTLNKFSYSKNSSRKLSAHDIFILDTTLQRWKKMILI